MEHKERFKIHENHFLPKPLYSIKFPCAPQTLDGSIRSVVPPDVTLVFVISESKVISYLSTVKDNMRGFIRIDVVPCERTDEQIQI